MQGASAGVGRSVHAPVDYWGKWAYLGIFIESGSKINARLRQFWTLGLRWAFFAVGFFALDALAIIPPTLTKTLAWAADCSASVFHFALLLGHTLLARRLFSPDALVVAPTTSLDLGTPTSIPTASAALGSVLDALGELVAFGAASFLASKTHTVAPATPRGIAGARGAVLRAYGVRWLRHFALILRWALLAACFLALHTFTIIPTTIAQALAGIVDCSALVRLSHAFFLGRALFAVGVLVLDALAIIPPTITKTLARIADSRALVDPCALVLGRTLLA